MVRVQLHQLFEAGDETGRLTALEPKIEQARQHFDPDRFVLPRNHERVRKVGKHLILAPAGSESANPFASSSATLI